MKNKVVERMMCDQFKWDFRDVEVVFISCIEGAYTFKVTHYPNNGGKVEVKTVMIKVEDGAPDAY